MSQEFCAKSKLILVRFLIYLRLRYRLLLPHILFIFILFFHYYYFSTAFGCPLKDAVLAPLSNSEGEFTKEDLILDGIVWVVWEPLGK